MPGGSGKVTRQDVAALEQLAKQLRDAAGKMTEAGRPLHGLSSEVSSLVGGTATGKDKDFATLLTCAGGDTRSAAAACQSAATAMARAAREAAQQLQEQEHRDRQKKAGRRV